MRTSRRTVTGVTALAAGFLTVAVLVPSGGVAHAAGDGLAVHRARSSAAPVPKGFKANSITWLNRDRAWVLGEAPCGKKTKACSSVIGTSDGGASWAEIGPISAPIPSLSLGGSGVTEVRFSSSKDGWAFAPDLYRTTDGGATWVKQPIPGHRDQVVALAATSSGAFLIAGKGVFDEGPSPLSLWHERIGASSWQRVHVDLPRAVHANVSVDGTAVYVADPGSGAPDTQKLYGSTDGGAHFAALESPCVTSPPSSLLQAVAYSDNDVAFLCEGGAAASEAAKYVFTSTDDGATDSAAGLVGLPGIQASLAVSPSGDLGVASESDGSFIFINDRHGTKWTLAVAESDGGLGWSDLGFSSNTKEWVVYAPPDGFLSQGQVWTSVDGGRHWTIVKL